MSGIRYRTWPVETRPDAAARIERTYESLIDERPPWLIKPCPVSDTGHGDIGPG